MSYTNITSTFNKAFTTALKSGESHFSGQSKFAFNYILDTYSDCDFTFLGEINRGVLCGSIDMIANSGDAFHIDFSSYDLITVTFVPTDNTPVAF